TSGAAAIPPRVGFTFRPHTAAGMGLEPLAALAQLLKRIQPDVVRLPVYWSDAAAARGRLDFSSADTLLGVVSRHDAGHPARRAHVVLVVGMRNVGYPELFAPAWALAQAGSQADALARLPEYSDYFDGAVRHFAGNGLLEAWQVENEPLDSSLSADVGDNSIPQTVLTTELQRLRQLDPRHRVLVTTYNSSTLDLDEAEVRRADIGVQPPEGPVQPGGHPEESLQLGDVLGLDLYVVYWGVDLTAVPVKQRIGWKRNTLPYWVSRARKRGEGLWIAEMQAGPWRGVSGFNPDDLVDSAAQYSRQGVDTILLWGVESWLTQPAWMASGLVAVRLIRTGTP
ncbi:MAG: endo-1,4-beta-xylanase, partial [Candidatus Dormibacteraeota bacterium]|nr:endo-1,4-beta-xylanase [Candidatus Dormibacteraeota bacterium]